MEARQFRARLRVITLILVLIIGIFTAVLHNLQIVHGADYREKSVRNITQTETVEAARGQILDRYGRVLVSNKTVYQVTLDTSLMGEESKRNPILLSLLEICREEGVEWTDEVLPISMTEPFTYTDDLTETGQARYEKFLEQMKWTEAAEQGPDILLAKMREFYKVDDSVSPEDGRALVGVLCELRMRSLDIVRTSYVFAQDVDIDFISRVKEEGLVGVTIEPTTVRQYNTTYAAHLLGRVGSMDPDDWEYYKNIDGYQMDDTVGKDGVEKAFESYLKGTAGQRAINTNTNGKIVSQYWLTDSETGETLEPEPGGNVSLTIDIRLQEVAERALANGIESLESEYTEGGAVVVTDMTGGVLAMASYPTYDLTTIYSDTAAYNEALNNPLKPFNNRAIYGLYSPGSTFKMIVGVAALQEGLVTPTEKIEDTGRFQYPAGEKYPYGDYHPACWYYLQYGGKHGMEDMANAIKDSCNIYFFTLGDRLGIDLIGEYASMFGLGESTGFELGGYSGRVAGPETSEALGMTWYGGDLLSASIGQGNTQATPLQLANYVATLVNGGDRYSTHILQSVKSSDFSEVVYEYEPQLLDSVDIDEENLEAVKYGMYLMANEGSVKNAFADLPVEVGAKTGTAQVGQVDSESNAVLVCFAPYDDPEIAISVVVEHGGSGTDLAGIAAEILSYYFSTGTTMESVDGENQLLH